MWLNRCEHVRAFGGSIIIIYFFFRIFFFVSSSKRVGSEKDIMRLHTLINRWKVGVLNSDGLFSTDFNQRIIFFSVTRSKRSNEVFQMPAINELKLYYYSMNRLNFFIIEKMRFCEGCLSLEPMTGDCYPRWFNCSNKEGKDKIVKRHFFKAAQTILHNTKLRNHRSFFFVSLTLWCFGLFLLFGIHWWRL